jgi:GH15 family glucan-1,4-alpha-glucosidase
VYAALIAAADLSATLGKDSHETTYRKAAEEIKTAILKYLWDDKAGVFINMMIRTDDGVSFDRTIDISSAYGIYSFDVLPIDDVRLSRAFETSVRVLSDGIVAGGIARFENDDYYQIVPSVPGNPWVITTLFYAEYLLDRAKHAHDLARIRDIFSWVTKHAQPSGVLSEQIHPLDGMQVGATPLTWAHAAYVTAVLKYIEKARALSS